MSDGGLHIRAGESSEQALDQAEEQVRERQTDAWHRELNEGRVEIMCKAPGYRVRVSAPEDEAWEVVELFEKWTGLHIQSERRPRKRVRPTPGQLSMVELESGGSDVTD